MPSGSNMNRLKCQSINKGFMSTGMIGKASHPESHWSTWATQSAWQKTSWLAWKLHSEWWHTPRHAACCQATDDRRGRDAPVLPMRGRLSRLWPLCTSDQWKNSVQSMDHCSGSNASVAQRTVEGHGFSKAKGIVFLGLSFSQEMILHLLPVPQLKITSSWQRNPSITLLLKLLSLSCCELCAKGICRIGFLDLHGSSNLLRPPKFPVLFEGSKSNEWWSCCRN